MRPRRSQVCDVPLQGTERLAFEASFKDDMASLLKTTTLINNISLSAGPAIQACGDSSESTTVSFDTTASEDALLALDRSTGATSCSVTVAGRFVALARGGTSPATAGATASCASAAGSSLSALGNNANTLGSISAFGTNVPVTLVGGGAGGLLLLCGMLVACKCCCSKRGTGVGFDEVERSSLTSTSMTGLIADYGMKMPDNADSARA